MHTHRNAVPGPVRDILGLSMLRSVPAGYARLCLGILESLLQLGSQALRGVWDIDHDERINHDESKTSHCSTSSHPGSPSVNALLWYCFSI